MKVTRQLRECGQSLWLDNITRELLDTGTLQRYISELSITGLTSNPTIFDHAIRNSGYYNVAIAEKASAAKGPTAVLVPRKGVSAIDAEGKPFWWPEADQALFESLRHWMSPQVELVELDLHINDPKFAETAAVTLLRFLKERTNNE